MLLLKCVVPFVWISLHECFYCFQPYKVHVEEQSDHDNIRDIEESSMETDELSSARHLSPPPVSSRGPRKKLRSEAVAAAQSACSRKFRSMAVIDAQKAANVKLTSAATASTKSVDDAAAGPKTSTKTPDKLSVFFTPLRCERFCHCLCCMVRERHCLGKFRKMISHA